MATRLRSNHLLISALAKRQKSKNALQAGFTLVELLIVVIIIGILSAVALPGFLNQAEKAKISAAKSIAASFAKECQIWLIEQDGAFVAKTVGSPQVTLTGTSCTSTGGGATATIVGSGKTAIVVIDAEGGIQKSGTVGTW